MKKILLIEDSKEVRENTAEILTLSNYEVITAENGKQGVELALAEIPDLVVCDIMMPLLDGYGVYHLLHKHAITAPIPFIFLTAKSEKADLRKAMGMGADDYIMKPFDGIELLDAIETRLSRAESIRQHYTAPDVLGRFLQDIRQTGKVKLTSGERETFSYNRKQVVYSTGQKPRAVYFIISGKVKITRMNDDGKELITGIQGPDTYLGYMDILEDELYREEAQALEDSVLMMIPRADFLELISADMQVAQDFIRLIAQCNTGQQERLLNFAYSSVRKKVAFGLISLLQTYTEMRDSYPVITLSRENMAQSIGIATESLVRTLSDFKDEKLVDIGLGKVIILNEKKLRELPY